MGAQVIGEGTHRLFGSTETGLAIKLKGWSYPIVIKNDCTVAFDDYNGAWGNKADIETLKAWYALSCAELECQNQGWYCELDSTQKKLTVYHPSGGTITVDASGTVDANGFVGGICAEATSQIEKALGTKVSETLKPEMNQTRLTQKETA